MGCYLTHAISYSCVLLIALCAFFCVSGPANLGSSLSREEAAPKERSEQSDAVAVVGC